MNNYNSTLKKIEQIKNSLTEHLELDYILPQEVKSIEELNLLPKESLAYFNSSQTIGLLNKFELGITLQKRLAESKRQTK